MLPVTVSTTLFAAGQAGTEPTITLAALTASGRVLPTPDRWPVVRSTDRET